MPDQPRKAESGAERRPPPTSRGGGHEPPHSPPAASEPAGGSLSMQAGVIIGTRAMAFVVSFAVPVILVRTIDPEQYGLFRQALLVVAIFGPILQFGMTQSLYYFYPRHADLRPTVVTQTIAFLVMTGAIFALVFANSRGLVGSYFKDPVMGELAPLIAPYVMLTVVSSVLEVLPIVQQRMRLVFWIIVSSEASRAVLLVGSAWMMRDVRAMLTALVLFSVLRCAALMIILQRQGLVTARWWNSRFMREQLAYSVPFGLAGVVVILIEYTDRLFISRYFDATRFAIYSFGNFHMPIVMIVFQSALSVMLGRMAALQSENRRDEMTALYRNAARKLGLIAVPLVAVCAVLAGELITVLFTDAYAEAAPVFMIFLALIPRAASGYATVTRAYGLTRWIFKVTLVALVIAVTLAFVLIRTIGFLGPAIAVVTALWVVAGAQIWKTGRLLETGVRGLYAWRQLCMVSILAASLALALAAVRALVQPAPAVMVFVGGPLFGVAYVGIAVATGIIRQDELRDLLRQFLQRLGQSRTS